MLSQARIALFAAILLFVLYVRLFASQTATLIAYGATVWNAGSLLISFLISMALPLMLAVWFRTGAEITLSKGLRWCAVGTAALFGAFLVLGVSTTAFTTALRQGRLVWLILRLLSDAALVLLLIALSRGSGDAAPERISGFGLLRNMALGATLAAVVVLVLNTTQLVESAKLLMAQHGGLFQTQGGHLEWVSRPTTPQIALSFVVNSLAPLCRLVIPLILYRSLSGGLCREDLGAAPDSLEQA